MSEWKDLKLDIQDAIAVVTINRPKVYNALTRDAKLELIKALRVVGRDANVRAVILTGEGKAFCTGQDLNDRTIQAGERVVDLGETLETEWNPLVDTIAKCPKIVIGAINGVVAGAGLSVAMACDLIISRPGVKYICGFSKLGLAPDAGSSFTFTRALGRQKALEFFLFNHALTAEQLHEYGLVNLVHEEAINEAKKMAQEISKLAPLSVKQIKSNTRHAESEGFVASINRETMVQRLLGNTQDYQEGLKAFFEKREPNFKGH